MGTIRKLQMSKNRQYYLTLPKSIVEVNGWGKGTKISIGLNERGNLELEEVRK